MRRRRKNQNLKLVMFDLPPVTVSEAVGLINQTLQYAYPRITVVGELAGYKIAKQQWLYGDLKDEVAKIRLFGTVYHLPGPLEDGRMLEITGEPRIHPQFGFSLQIQSIRPVGEGSIKKAQSLLEATLRAEGLFEQARKRSILYPPETVGLIASKESAAYADFVKIASSRWQGFEIILYDSLVQGEGAVDSVVAGMQYFNQQAALPDVLVVIRGGGSADDLQAFSHERVVRAIATSRVPTAVAIGHEIDVSLAELAADLHGSTPSNIAELLFPERDAYTKTIASQKAQLVRALMTSVDTRLVQLQHHTSRLQNGVSSLLVRKEEYLRNTRSILDTTHPSAALKRGFTIMEVQGKLVTSVAQLKVGASARLTMLDGTAETTINEIGVRK